jgi:hypothetical protein
MAPFWTLLVLSQTKDIFGGLYGLHHAFSVPVSPGCDATHRERQSYLLSIPTTVPKFGVMQL